MRRTIALFVFLGALMGDSGALVAGFAYLTTRPQVSSPAVILIVPAGVVVISIVMHFALLAMAEPQA